MTDAEDNPVDPQLTRPRVADEELVLRALHEPFWDAEKQRATPSAFGNGNCFSLSRPAVLPEAAIQNPAHAELVGSNQAGTRLRKITRGVGSQILKQCRFRTL